MSYWLFAALCAFAIAILNGFADSMTLVLLLSIVAPLFVLGLAAQFFRSIFSQSIALRFNQVVAGAAAIALIFVYYFAP